MLGQPITPLVITGTTYSSPNLNTRQHESISSIYAVTCHTHIVYFVLAEWKLQQRACYSSVYCNTSIGMEEKTLLFTLDKKTLPFISMCMSLQKISHFAVHISISLQKIDNLFISSCVC